MKKNNSRRIMDHPALGVIIPGLVEAACQSVLEASAAKTWGFDGGRMIQRLGLNTPNWNTPRNKPLPGRL